MTPPEGLRHVRVVRAALHHPCTKEEYAEIVWETVEEKFVFVTNTAKYSGDYPNQAGVFATRRWAPEWDGESFAELVANAKARAAQHDAVVVFRDGQPGLVNRADAAADGQAAEDSARTAEPVPSCGGERILIKLAVDRSALSRLPDSIEPNAVNAKALFDAMTAETDRDDANTVWVMMAAEVGPMQIDFTPDQWQLMIDKIRNLETKTFTMKRDR